MRLSERHELLLSYISSKPKTANQVITDIFKDDLDYGGAEFIVTQRGFKFYVHLNKLFSPLEKDLRIKNTGKIKVKGRYEKLWITTPKSNKRTSRARKK